MVSVITLNNITSFEYVWKKAMTDDYDLQKDDQHSKMIHYWQTHAILFGLGGLEYF